MAKQAILTTITSTNNNAATLNANFNALNAALLNTVSRDGSTPNNMDADLDLNSQDIINIQDTFTQQLYLAGNLVANLGFFPEYKGVWATSTSYTAYDLVYHDDGITQSLYRARTTHTSGTFVTDRDANEYWERFTDQVIDQADVRITGGSIDGTTVGATTPSTGAFTTVTVDSDIIHAGDADNKIVFDTDTQDFQTGAASRLDISDSGVRLGGANARVTTVLDEDDFNSNSDTALATQQSIKAYVDTGDATQPESFVIACSDETSDLAVGTAVATFRMPYAFTVTEVRASVTTAPTGSVLTVDINESGTSILSTKLTIDAGEKTSETAATPPVISDSSLADDAEMTIDIDGVGSTVAGTGLKVTIIGTQA